MTKTKIKLTIKMWQELMNDQKYLIIPKIGLLSLTNTQKNIKCLLHFMTILFNHSATELSLRIENLPIKPTMNQTVLPIAVNVK